MIIYELDSSLWGKKVYFCTNFFDKVMTANKSDETLLDVADAYSKTEKFVNNNGKNLTMALAVVVGLLLAFVAYKKFIVEPQNEEASQMIWKAEFYFEQDSLNLALNGDGNNYGFLEIIETYGGTPTGNLAKHYAGACYLNMGEFDLAMDYFQDCSFDDVMLESSRLGAIGDCYVNSGDFSNGVSYFDKSVSYSDNEFTAPIYLKKAGLAYEELGQNAKALQAFERIKKDYSNTTIGRGIEKHLARARAMAN